MKKEHLIGSVGILNFALQGPVSRSMVSVYHWLSSIRHRLSWYLMPVITNNTMSNSALNAKIDFTRITSQAVIFFSNFTY